MQLQLSYPMVSTSLSSQKLVMFMTGGYAMTTTLPLLLQGYTPLWVNTNIGMYVYQQLNNVIAPFTFTLLGLVNP